MKKYIYSVRSVHAPKSDLPKWIETIIRSEFEGWKAKAISQEGSGRGGRFDGGDLDGVSYFSFGTYGATLMYYTSRNWWSKHVNDWKNKSVDEFISALKMQRWEDEGD